MVKNAIIIGGQRCGSTMLFANIARHNNVVTPSHIEGEPKYFLNSGIKCSASEYQKKVFGKYSQNALLLEKSTSYYETPSALRRIKETLPECEIILILRDPIIRAISNYHFSFDNGIEDRSLNEAIMSLEALSYDSKISVSPFAYKERGLYASYIESVFEIFEEKKVNIIIFEELIGRSNIFQKLTEKLGLNESNLGLTLKPDLRRNESSASQKKCDHDTLRSLQDYYRDDVVQVFAGSLDVDVPYMAWLVAGIYLGRRIAAWDYILDRN